MFVCKSWYNGIHLVKNFNSMREVVCEITVIIKTDVTKIITQICSIIKSVFQSFDLNKSSILAGRLSETFP